ncbi:MAG: UPF0158 family protein [Gemmatimonadota bacterium]
MSTPVKLSRIVEALDYPDDWQCFLDRSTGKVVTITEDERPYLDGEGDDEFGDLPEWHREIVGEVRRALESGDLVELPNRFDVHEWDVMRRFSSSRSDPARGELLDAIHGRGAFRLFRRTIERLGLREAWFEYRTDALRVIARDWLEENEIEFVEE